MIRIPIDSLAKYHKLPSDDDGHHAHTQTVVGLTDVCEQQGLMRE